jgi:hypothetical protein
VVSCTGAIHCGVVTICDVVCRAVATIDTKADAYISAHESVAVFWGKRAAFRVAVDNSFKQGLLVLMPCVASTYSM